MRLHNNMTALEWIKGQRRLEMHIILILVPTPDLFLTGASFMFICTIETSTRASPGSILPQL